MNRFDGFYSGSKPKSGRDSEKLEGTKHSNKKPTGSDRGERILPANNKPVTKNENQNESTASSDLSIAKVALKDAIKQDYQPNKDQQKMAQQKQQKQQQKVPQQSPQRDSVDIGTDQQQKREGQKRHKEQQEQQEQQEQKEQQEAKKIVPHRSAWQDESAPSTDPKKTNDGQPQQVQQQQADGGSQMDFLVNPFGQQQPVSSGIFDVVANWQKNVGAAKIIWGRITDNKMLQSEGRTDQLIGLVKEHYAISREDAEKQVRKFLLACDLR